MQSIADGTSLAGNLKIPNLQTLTILLLGIALTDTHRYRLNKVFTVVLIAITKN